MDNLFDYSYENEKKKQQPLASRMRPETLDEVVGQKHIIGKDRLLYRAIRADRLSSIIFYGPPGTGKTTMAHVIANTSSSAFFQVNATTAGKKDMEAVISKAKEIMAEKPFCLLMKSIDSIKRSRIICCHLWKMVQSF